MNGQNRGRGQKPRPAQPGQPGRQPQRPPQPRQEEPIKPLQPVGPPPDCPVCGKPITDIFAAIAWKENSEPAHFECVMKWLGDAEKIAEDERLVYIGNGAFGVVPATAAPGQKFVIKRMIQYEGKEKKPEWRKELSSRYASK